MIFKYTSHDIQNEMLKIAAVKILRQISQRIRDGGWYTVLADECTELSKKGTIHHLYMVGRPRRIHQSLSSRFH